MNVAYEKIKKLVPYQICTKQRENYNILIVSNDENEIIYLNETSMDFYRFCDGEKNIGDIFYLMLNIYDVPEDDFQSDIVSLIRDMQWNHILGLKEV